MYPFMGVLYINVFLSPNVSLCMSVHTNLFLTFLVTLNGDHLNPTKKRVNTRKVKHL